MKYLNLTVSALLTAFATSIVWLFVSHRLYEPNLVYWWVEVILASSCAVLGIVAAELNIRHRKK